MAHVQARSADGVPPLELTGERTLPDVPGENYWYRRHLAVYEWIAARSRAARCRPRLRRGLWLGRARRDGGRRDRRRRQPRGPRARRLRYRRPNLRFERALVEEFTGPARRGRLPADDRAHPGARQACSAGSPAGAPVAYISTPNRLTLAPPRAPRSPTTRGTCASTRRPSTGSCSSRASPRSRSSASSTPASCALHELALAPRLGPRPQGAAHHQALLRPLHARDLGLRLRAAHESRPTSRAPSTSSPSAVPERSEPGRVGDLAIVLHSHMPYVEGFGTYPFGEEWLFDAVLPLLSAGAGRRRQADDDGHPGARRPARGAGAGRARCARSSASSGWASCRADADERRRRLQRACHAEADRYRRGLDQLEAAAASRSSLSPRPSARAGSS